MPKPAGTLLRVLTIDRIAPTRRPNLPEAGTQSWRDLLFVHWRLPRKTLRKVIPPELELDDYQGETFVGIVPFKMRNIRSSWMPKRSGLNFLETNLRTYVLYNQRPGVYFLSLEASSLLAVKVARWVWQLPYHHATMSHHQSGQVLRYESRRKKTKTHFMASFRPGTTLGPSQPGSLEHFLLERYLLFSKRNTEILEGRVYHAPYPAYHAEVDELSEELFSVADLPATRAPPDLVHFSPGVNVSVYGPWPVDDKPQK